MSAYNQQDKEEKRPGLWTRYRNWLAGLSMEQRRRARLLQIVGVLGAVVIAVCLVLWVWIRVPDIPAVDPDVPGQGVINPDSSEGMGEQLQLPEVAKSGRKEGYYTFLVAGRDVLTGATDTMLLFTFDTQGKTLNAISLPRDTMINTASASKRLNAVFGRNRGSSDLTAAERTRRGMNALKQEVSKLTGILPDFYVLVEWDAIGELVDALGGVEFDVPYEMHYEDPEQDLYIHQEKGLRVLNGDDAMQVIRWRKNNGFGEHIQIGDSGRMKVQQDFLMAVLKECMDPATLLKIPSLAQVFLDNVNTDLTVGNILAFAQRVVGIDLEQDVHFTTMPYTGVSYHKASMVVPVGDKLLELLNGGLNPYQDDIRLEDLQLVYQKSDGSFGVTSGTVADPNMEKVPVSKPAQEQPPEQLPGEELPEEPLPPDTGLEELPGLLDPDQVLPEPPKAEPDDVPQDITETNQADEPVAEEPAAPAA